MDADNQPFVEEPVNDPEAADAEAEGLQGGAQLQIDGGGVYEAAAATVVQPPVAADSSPSGAGPAPHAPPATGAAPDPDLDDLMREIQALSALRKALKAEFESLGHGEAVVGLDTLSAHFTPPEDGGAGNKAATPFTAAIRELMGLPGSAPLEQARPIASGANGGRVGLRGAAGGPWPQRLSAEEEQLLASLQRLDADILRKGLLAAGLANEPPPVAAAQGSGAAAKGGASGKGRAAGAPVKAAGGAKGGDPLNNTLAQDQLRESLEKLDHRLGALRRKMEGVDELLKELNSGGAGWLPNEDEQDWGLDDVAVLVQQAQGDRARCTAQALRLKGVTVRVRQQDGEDEDYDDAVDDAPARGGRYGRGYSDEDDMDLDLSLDLDTDLLEPADGSPGTSGRGEARAGAGVGGAAGAKAGAGVGSSWYNGLTAAGFSVRTNEAGEVFLERTVKRKAPASPAGGSGAAAASGRSAAAGTSGTVATAPGAGRTGPAVASPPPSAPERPVPPLEPFSGRPPVVAALQQLSTPQQVLDFLELSYPAWAANGYRLVDMRSGRPVAAPSPAEAAHCLRALALTARRNEIGGWRCLDLAASRQGQGLAECLRATPPRLLPEQATPQLSASYFEAARAYWLEPAAGPLIDDPKAKADRSPPAAGAAAAATATASASPAATAAASASSSAPPTAEAGTAAADGEGEGGLAALESFAVRDRTAEDKEYDALVAKYKVLGQRKEGGSPYFAAETEALLAILVRCLAAAASSSTPLSPPSLGSGAAAAASGPAAAAAVGGLCGWQAGQVLWALGNSRHASPRLADLEASMLRTGGLAAMQPRDVSRVLWGFASLGARPERLLLTIRPDWAWSEGGAGAEAAGDARGRKNAGRRKQAPQQQSRGGGSCGDVRDFSPSQLAGVVWALASGYQRSLANTLSGLRYMHLLEDNSTGVWAGGGEGYSVDITLPALRIAIEADGPTHTSRTPAPGGGVLGATAMKRRHLELMGWQVINVTYKERINEALVRSVEFREEGEEGNAAAVADPLEQ
ncbi:hypothetical protein GPECTOR_5g404 [Gonium pectorale]|uniref:RAP domain-containing protein n=1 Tax=Gonium pectorale TaxID=33097 RepID=A0A150GWU4_GONPE|nr:hypothetical protein GPECTOR_5g404 [Gonium pectorale]|eukprot:KXZ54321.1 hypothetical protein GPECTOR_5g404 [Gonium pectorale]